MTNPPTTTHDRRAAVFTLASLLAALVAMPAAAASRKGAGTGTKPAPAPAPPAADPGPLPDDSIYHLDAQLTDHEGRTQPLVAHRGQPLLVTMFYTGCQAVCPMIVEALRHTESKLPPADRARLQVLMISFDSEHDTVPVLQRMVRERGLDARRWSLARADAKTVRQIAALLGIQYRLLSDGGYNHSSALLAIDAQGRIAARTSKIGSADPTFVAQVRGMLHPGAA